MAANRREFLAQVAATAAAVVAVPRAGRLRAQSGRVERVGMQLYTVRDLMAKDFEGTLARIAELGYKEVEFAGYFEKSPKDVRAVLDKLGLTSPSTPAPASSRG